MRSRFSSKSWVTRLVRSWSTPAQARGQDRRALRLEPLEDRSVPATFQNLYSFLGDGSTGAVPHSNLIADANGDLIGTTTGGGANGFGAVFMLAKSGSTYSAPTILYSFTAGTTDGYQPYGGLVMDSNGDLFGTTFGGGNGYTPSNMFGMPPTFGTPGDGTIYELIPSGGGTYTEQVLYKFTDGADGTHPLGGLLMDSSGNLYGTTSSGTTVQGSVFELAKTGLSSYSPTLTILDTFTGTNGSNAQAPLTADATGDIFGVTRTGGANGDGVVFEIPNIAGSFAGGQTLYDFTNGADGSQPYNGVVLDAAGDLFGTTSVGGGSGKNGTVFEMTNLGEGYSPPTTLYAFSTAPDGNSPQTGLIIDPAGNLFGTTFFGGGAGDNGGTVFELQNTGGTYASTPVLLHSFDGTQVTPAEGATPQYSYLLMDGSGNLFGTTVAGGNAGAGTVYEIGAGISGSINASSTTATVGQSSNVTFTVTPSGTSGTVSYQWQISTDGGATWTNISGATGATLTVTPGELPAPPGAKYRAYITDSDGDFGISNTAPLTVSSAPSVSAPTITNVSPNTGSTSGGTTVTLTGTNFLAGATVTVGGVAATNVVVVNSTTITFTTPAGANGPADVVVTNTDGGTDTDEGAFTYSQSAPTIGSVSPASGPASGGTTITITGTNFSEGATVLIGGVPATSVVVDGSTEITVVVPAGTVGAANVVVTNPGGATVTSIGGFTYVAVPAHTLSNPLTQVSVAFGPQGEVIELVDSTGTLTQYDASGAHVLATGVQSAGVAFGPGGQVLMVTYRTGSLVAYDATGAHVLTTGGVLNASVAFGPGGEVLMVTYQTGSLVAYDATGAHVLTTGGVLGTAVTFNRGEEALAVVYQNGALVQYDDRGAHQSATNVLSAGETFGQAAQPNGQSGPLAPYTEVGIVLYADGTLEQYDAFGSHRLSLGGVEEPAAT